MAVSIDTVYQKVLAIANKEQRGYITPQEFNLFADQVQMDIFEQYFYDINQFGRAPGNNTDYADMLDLLEEKIAIFKNIKLLYYHSPYYQCVHPVMAFPRLHLQGGSPGLPSPIHPSTHFAQPIPHNHHI